MFTTNLSTNCASRTGISYRISVLRSTFSSVIGLICVAAAFQPAVANAQFTDNFNTVANGQNDPNFGNDTSGWSVSNPTGSNGAYQNNQSQVFNFSTLTAPGYTSLTDCAVSFDLLSADDSGAVLHSDASAQNAFAVIIRPRQNDFYFIQRLNGNYDNANHISTTDLGGALSGGNYRVNVSVVGSTYSASVADLATPNTPFRTISYIDSSKLFPSSGRFGFYQYGPVAPVSRFDNLTVTNTSVVVVPEASSMVLIGGVLMVCGGAVVRRRSIGNRHGW